MQVLFKTWPLVKAWALETRGHSVGPAEGETDCCRALGFGNIKARRKQDWGTGDPQ